MNTQEIENENYLVKENTISDLKGLLLDIKGSIGQGKFNQKIKELEEELKQIKKIKKYGLIWEDKIEQFNKESVGKLPVLEEIKERHITENEDKSNILIEGDNYHSLSVLSYTHKGKIDVIYIDPPYNTGNNDFIYNDKIVDKEDKFRHSKWLSFMNKRLKLAKDLLSETGVIFISIDDNEFSQLKLLCDEIFGEINGISNIVRITTKRVKGDSEDINKIHDYVVLYSKTQNFNIQHLNKEDYSIYTEEDEWVEERGKYLIRPLDNGTINYSKNCDYEIIAPDGSLIVAGGNEILRKQRLNLKHGKKDWCFRWKKEKFEWGLKNGFIVFKNNNGKYRVYFKIYQFVDNKLKSTEKYDNHLSLIEGCYNNQGTTEIKNILGTGVFSYPKPISLIKKILSMQKSIDLTVLDFFAGSGTTGHTVLELNKEDGGNRQFILCTNNENKICEEVTYERIKRVMKGYKNSKGEQIEGLGGNLKYLKTAFIDKIKGNDDLRKRMVARCTELLCLKENIWEIFNPKIKKEVKGIKKGSIKFFKRDDKYLAILFDMFYFDEFKELLKGLDKEVAIYVFSNYKLLKEDFEGLKIPFEIEEIPDPILEVYAKIFEF